MSQKQAAWASVGEYLQKRQAFEKQQQLEWERARWMAYGIIAPFLGKNGPKSPKKWVQFPWDSATINPPIKVNESQVNALNKIYKDFADRKKSK